MCILFEYSYIFMHTCFIHTNTYASVLIDIDTENQLYFKYLKLTFKLIYTYSTSVKHINGEDTFSIQLLFRNIHFTVLFSC